MSGRSTCLALFFNRRASLRLYGLISLVVLPLLYPLGAEACRCRDERVPVRSSYARAYAVVRARVTDVTGDINTAGGTVSALSVSEAWKEDTQNEIKVVTNTTCAFEFKVGQEYLVFLYREGGGGYYTSRCVGNRVISNAKESLMWLRRHGLRTTVKGPLGC